MKLLKVFGIFAVLMMTVALSSCVKNDDSEDLDKKWQDWVKQVDTEIKASVGSYEGKCTQSRMSLLRPRISWTLSPPPGESTTIARWTY